MKIILSKEGLSYRLSDMLVCNVALLVSHEEMEIPLYITLLTGGSYYCLDYRVQQE